MSLKKVLKFVKKALKPKLELAKGTRFASVLFIALALLVATGALFAANSYYDLDTKEVVTEEVQRITELTRATGGLIAGGASDQSLSGDAILQVSGGTFTVDSSGNTDVGGTLGVTGTSSFTATTTFEDDAVWADGTDVAGFDNAQGGNVVYSLPSDDTPPGSDLVLSTDGSGNLEWTTSSSTLATSSVEGDITAVGDIEGPGGAFTTSTPGTTLWFQRDSATSALTVASGANATYTLPNIGDVNATVTVATSSLRQGNLLFANAQGVLTENSNLNWDTTNSQLDVSGTVDATDLRFGGGMLFQATSSPSATYTFPNVGDSGQVLTTDKDGNLSWSDVDTASGGISGSGSKNRLTKWKTNDNNSLVESAIYSSSTEQELTIGDSSSTFANTLNVENNLDVANTITGATATLAQVVQSPKFTATSGDTTIGSGESGGIVLNPGSGIVELKDVEDHIETNSGYKIGDTGNQKLIGMESVLGHDIPVRCSSSCSSTAATISKTVTNYPFDDAPTGADRVHRFIITYSDTIGNGSSTWRFVDETGTASNATFTVPRTGTTSTSTLVDHEQSYITPDLYSLTDWNGDSFPTSSDWHLEVKTGSTGATTTIQVNDIFLAAYDELQ